MTLSRGLGLAGIAAIASLTGVSGQAFYGGDQQAACSAFTNFEDLGCYVGDIRAARQYLFEPQNYQPGNDPSDVYPGFWPGTVFNNTVTPGACAEACRGFGFGIAALYDGICSCGYLPPAGTTGGTCDLPCTGDSDQNCGGADSTQVFGDPSFADPQQLIDVPQSQLAAGYQFLGCFNIPASTGFPTQNQANSAGTAATAQVCHERCATLGYPLAYASYVSTTEVNCECGETFGSGNYRVDENTEAECLSPCDSAAIGGCDLTSGICCGSGDFQAVYINPELEGCFVPAIPGYGEVDPDTAAVTAFACGSVPASLTAGPSSLTRRADVTAVLDPYGPEPTHPFSVAGTAGDFYEYGCVTGAASDVFVDGSGLGAFTLVTVPGATTVEGCGLACGDTPYFAVTDGDACYCATAIVDGLTFEDFGLCNTRCEGSATELCGGANTLEIYAQADFWDSDAALQLRIVAEVSPIPTQPCTTTATGTGTGTGTVPTGTGTGTGTGLPTGTGTGTGTGTAASTGTGSDTLSLPTLSLPSFTGLPTDTLSLPTLSLPSFTGLPTDTLSFPSFTGLPTDTLSFPSSTGSFTDLPTSFPESTGSFTDLPTSFPESTGSFTDFPTGTSTGSAVSSGTVIPSQPPAANHYIFGVNRLDGTGDDTFAKRSIKSVNSGFIGNAGPGRAATQKRQDGFVGGAGPLNPTDCTLATPFQFVDGELVSGGETVSTDPGVDYTPFYTNPVAGSITTEFSIGDNILLWGNAAFTDFYADFCQDTYGQVWIIFNAAAPPFDCTPVELVVYGVPECAPNGEIISVAPTGTALPTATGTGTVIESATVTGGTATVTDVSTTSAAATLTSGASSIVDATLTLGDHTYAFPAQITPGDYGCFTENATWVEGQTRPTLFVGAV